MNHRTTLSRHLAKAALCAGLAFAPFVQAEDAAPQRVALAAPLAKAQPVAAPAAPRRAEPVAAKKAPRDRDQAVNYERDLWRHQGAS